MTEEIKWGPEVIQKWCVIKYDRDIYPGIITTIDEVQVQERCMHRVGVNRFFWPTREDMIWYLFIYFWYYLFIYLFSHLADAFVHSDLQMRAIEAIKTNKRATTCKCYDKSWLAKIEYRKKKSFFFFFFFF